ncbi:MAG TPA: ROK family protein [Gaiellaceae bacterium]|nr:ROK family protein [Gaiellaceae bacterium]
MASPRVIALDLGGTKLLSGVVDDQGVVEKRVVAATDVSSEDAVLTQVEDAVQGLMEEDIGAIGIGIPSTIDQRRGEAIDSVNIPLSDVPLRDRLLERFRMPVAVENDANAAALAEHRYGAGRGSRHMVMLTLGTGVGGGLILDGELYRGAIGAAAELGHITLDLNGPPCQGNCPGRGHLEAMASGTAADGYAREAAERNPDGDLGRAAADGKNVDARLAVELAAHGPGDARDVLDHVGFHLGVGIASFVNIFNPELVVIGGGFSRAGDLLFEPARRVVAERALSPAKDEVKIVPALLGVEAGLIGAGLVGFEALHRGH